MTAVMVRAASHAANEGGGKPSAGARLGGRACRSPGGCSMRAATRGASSQQLVCTDGRWSRRRQRPRRARRPRLEGGRIPQGRLCTAARPHPANDPPPLTTAASLLAVVEGHGGADGARHSTRLFAALLHSAGTESEVLGGSEQNRMQSRKKHWAPRRPAPAQKRSCSILGKVLAAWQPFASS